MTTHNPTSEIVSSVLEYRRNLKAPRQTDTAIFLAKSLKLHPLMIVATLKVLQEQGYGEFIVGRRGGVTRFVWSGKALDAVPPAKPVPETAAKSVPPPKSAAIPYPVQRSWLAIPIRGGKAAVYFSGPPGLTASDLFDIAQLFEAMSAEVELHRLSLNAPPAVTG